MNNSVPRKKHKGGWKQSNYQKTVSRKVMLRLRREQPEKFVHRKPKPIADPAAPVKTQPEPEIKTTPAAPPSQTPPQPSPTTNPVPALPEIKPDTTLFGDEEVQPPKIDGGATPPPVEALPGTPGSGSPGELAAPPESVKKYAVLVWGMIVKVCCAIFGEGFKPIILKSETGEVLYDESAEGVKVWWNWLVSVGIKTFSPLVELWIFMIAYFTIRFQLIVARFRKKKQSAPTGSPPPGETEKPAPPAPDKTQPTGTAPPMTPEPAPKREAPQATQEELSEGEENFR
jgi:hypothetical protein